MTFLDMFYLQHSKVLNDSCKKLKNFRDMHKNQRCFIVATGPSINVTDFSKLKGEIVFGVNSLYNALDRFDKCPQYWGVSDCGCFVDDIEKFLSLDTTLFLGLGAGCYYLKNKDKLSKIQKREPIILKGKRDMVIWNEFSTDITSGTNDGGAVTIDICIQVAYYMGFQEVYLIGCDCGYKLGFHFYDLNNPMLNTNWDKTFSAYKVCKDVFEKDGRKIYNATVGGNLEVFERRDLIEI
jgi:hypothetical protein